jgi:hypothetical protein
LAECVVNYSAETARAAARAFLWRRYLTKQGLFFLGALILLTAQLILFYHWSGADWFVGVLGTIIGFNLLVHVTSFSALPRAMAKAVMALPPPRTGGVSTRGDGITLALGGNVSVLPWTRLRYIWPQEKFILLGFRFSMFRVVHVPTDGMTPEVRAEFLGRASPVFWG